VSESPQRPTAPFLHLPVTRLVESVTSRERALYAAAERRASVAAIFHVPAPETDGEPASPTWGDVSVLLIRRSDAPGDPWSGHMAMPGGKQEPNDVDLVHTAIRETEEEVGLTLDRDAQLIGALDDVPAFARGRRTGLVVTPHLFVLTGAGPRPTLRPSFEVQESLWVPVSRLLAPDSRRERVYDVEGVPMRLPAWDYDGRLIWGLTHHMLSGLLRLAGEST
jgi:8-oxo-dGTP pyrophosphatase MutT (NUDIX family)